MKNKGVITKRSCYASFVLALFLLCAIRSNALNPQFISIADSIVKYQLDNGGWVKNQNWENGADAQYISECNQSGIGACIDNKATWGEMRHLAMAYSMQGKEQYRQSFIKGLKYLLSAQYFNGGWPQYFPARTLGHYSSHITFNDGAMVNVLRLMRDISCGLRPFDSLIIPDTLIASVKQAYEKGVECILNCQIVVDGMPTVWCQQHDSITLLPAQGRAYELPSFSAHGETPDIINFLMDIDSPSERVVRAVDNAIRWLKEHELKDVALEHFVNNEGKPDIRIVHSEEANGLWARFYDLQNAKPLFCDRDGIPQIHIEDIGYERRMGYSWFGNSPAKVIERYEEWRLRNIF